MALPTIPCYWTTRRNLYDQAITQRRNHETDMRQKWIKNADYFNKSNILVAKQKSWESETSTRDSLDSYKEQNEKEVKALNLKRRRLKLAELLKQERSEYEAELKGYSRDNYSRLEDMKERTETLRSAREEKRKRVADEKLYEHWRQNNPDLRQIERLQLEEHVVQAWPDQLEEQRERTESARREKEEYEQEMEKERIAALREDQHRAAAKLQDEKRLKNVLREQVTELKEREREAESLKTEQENLQKQQWELEQIEDQRKRTETARQKQELGRVLLRQHKAQMMNKSRKIQQELEMDKKILEELIRKEKDDEQVMTARREKAQADASWMKEVIEDQLKLEKAREAELDLLYQDEAARMWQKREGEWEKERKARERLMNEVLEERQKQIEVRMEEIQIEREESLQQREQLLREMEIANQLTQREQRQAEREREAFKEDLQAQLTARYDQEEFTRRRMEEELEEQRKLEEAEEDLLRQEAERMRIEGFAPRQHGRKQAWM